MKKVFIYVGHSNWGKSMALKAITDGNSHKKITNISGKPIRVRKMSNDDDGQGLLDWVTDIPRKEYDYFIIAFCPNFPPVNREPTNNQNTGLKILTELKKTNELFFFIQEEKYNNSKIQISQYEINYLRNYGITKVLSGQNKCTTRAMEFKKFINNNI